MKTNMKIFGALAVIALALASVGSVSADTIDRFAYGAGFGMGSEEENEGLLAEYMEAAIAESLGLSVEELDVLEADGATHYTIALELGFSVEEFEAIMEDAQEKAIALAAEDGIFLQQFGMGGMGREKIGFDSDDATPGRNGAGLMNAEDCEAETCTAQPLEGGMMRRGGRR